MTSKPTIRLDREDIETIVVALRHRALDCQELAKANARGTSGQAILAAAYCREQSDRAESIANQLSGLGPVIVTDPLRELAMRDEKGAA